MYRNHSAADHVFAIFVKKLRTKLTGFKKAPSHVPFRTGRTAAYDEKPLGCVNVPGELGFVLVTCFQTCMVNEDAETV
jgi:hypothetical protein